MPRFSANLSLLFTEVSFLERFAAAADAGFSAVECQFPYAWAADDIATALARSKLQLVLHNLPAGAWEQGERGIACHPARIDEFRAGVRQAIEYAQALGCPRLNCLAGLLPAGVSPALAHRTLVDNLRHAAQALADAGLQLLVEPVNHFDMPGFVLNYTAQAAALLDEVGAPNLFIQYDVYHAQRMEGELAATLAHHLPRIGHIQIADNPGRHEPGSGEIHYHWLLGHLDRIGYSGWVGCEYRPAAGTLAGLGWCQDYLRAPAPRHPHGQP